MAATTETINSPIQGASLVQVWKPLHAVGSASDGTAPFKLTTKVLCTGTRGLGQFVRIGAAGVVADAAASVTSGVTSGAAGSGNSWTNGTGVDLVEGDYAFLTTAEITT